MKQLEAVERIERALSEMADVLGEAVFDEWTLVKRLSKGWHVLNYVGAREEAFKMEFATDIAAMKETVLDLSKTYIGDSGFSYEGHGSGFDAYICVGDGLFLFLNNVQKSTSEITSSPKWKQAQIHYATLLEAFAADALVM